MAPTHQDNHPGNHPSRLADLPPPGPSPSSDAAEVHPDRGIRLEALFLAGLILLGFGSTVWSWFA